jgi:hypothetical protein
MVFIFAETERVLLGEHCNLEDPIVTILPFPVWTDADLCCLPPI